MDKIKDDWLEQFVAEQKHCQKQADRNEAILDVLCAEWKKYPDGKPIIEFVGYGDNREIKSSAPLQEQDKNKRKT